MHSESYLNATILRNNCIFTFPVLIAHLVTGLGFSDQQCTQSYYSQSIKVRGIYKYLNLCTLKVVSIWFVKFSALNNNKPR